MFANAIVNICFKLSLMDQMSRLWHWPKIVKAKILKPKSGLIGSDGPMDEREL